MTAFRATPPAKVNLVLEVAGRRPDGYHELRSVMAPLALTDALVVRPAIGSGGDELRQSGATRIDTATHFDNPGARRFYRNLGFESLREERLSCLL